MLKCMLKFLFPNLVKHSTITVIIKPVSEHDPKAKSTVYPETETTFNEMQQYLHQQLKKQYDTKRSS